MRSGPNDRIPGYGGGVKSSYKSFLSEKDLDNFNQTVVSLYTTNDIFRKTANRLQSSKSAYRIQQRYETDASGFNASYSPSNKTISFNYFGASAGELFEEVFHAGQDDYYSSLGVTRNSLSDEVEAKAANIISGFKDMAVKDNRDYKVIADYFKTGKKGKGFDNAVDNLINDTYDVYSKAKGESWSKENTPSSVDRSTLFRYLEHTTGVSDGGN